VTQRDDTDIRESLLSYYASQATSQATILLTIVLVAIGVLQLDANRLPVVVSNGILSLLAAVGVRSLIRIAYWGAMATHIQNAAPRTDGDYATLRLMSQLQEGALAGVKGETGRSRREQLVRRIEVPLFAKWWIRIAIYIVASVGTFILLQYGAAILN
jgi:hypothetical protein